jgi:hypothetical protein
LAVVLDNVRNQQGLPVSGRFDLFVSWDKIENIKQILGNHVQS